MNGPVFVASVIDRDLWDSDISFVGHENTIQVAVSVVPLLHVREADEVGIRRSIRDCSQTMGQDRLCLRCWLSAQMIIVSPFGRIHIPRRW